MKERRQRAIKARKPVKNPVGAASGYPPPFPQLTRVGDLPGASAVLRRARTPYKKSPLSEDEALNLICDARRDERTYPIDDLLKKF